MQFLISIQTSDYNHQFAKTYEPINIYIYEVKPSYILDWTPTHEISSFWDKSLYEELSDCNIISEHFNSVTLKLI